MNECLAAPGAPHGFPVDVHARLVGRRHRGVGRPLLHPLGECLHERLRRHCGEHTPERVVGRDAVLQLKQRLEEVSFAVPEMLHVGEGFAAADHTAELDREDVDQTVPEVRILSSRVVDLIEVGHKRSGLHHGLLAAAKSGPHHDSNLRERPEQTLEST